MRRDESSRIGMPLLSRFRI